MRRRLAGALGLGLFGIAWAAGCASTPQARRMAAPAPPPRAVSFDDALAAYDAYCRGLESFSAKGDLEVRDLRAGRMRRLGVRLVAVRGGKLYIKASVAVVTALEVVADGERFWFVVPSKKTIWTGAAGSAPRVASDDAPYSALRPSDIGAALLPEPLQLAAGESLSFEAEHDAVALTLAGGPPQRGIVRRQIVLDRASLEPRRLRTFDAAGELLTDASLSGFEGGLPSRVAVSRPVEGYLASFALENVRKNVGVPERAFTPRLPQGYKVVEVQ